jgi:hypothetical protein
MFDFFRDSLRGGYCSVGEIIYPNVISGVRPQWRPPVPAPRVSIFPRAKHRKN